MMSTSHQRGFALSAPAALAPPGRFRSDVAQGFVTLQRSGTSLPGTEESGSLSQTELQKGQRWLTSLSGNVSQQGCDVYHAHVQQQWQYAHAHQQDDQQRAFEQALLAVQSAQSATAITPSSRDFEKRVAILQAEEKALQACAEENERRFAVENAALDSRRHEAAIASGVADNRERAQKKRERALDLRDSGVSAREDCATQREQAVHAREGVLDQSVQNEIQGWLQHIEDHDDVGSRSVDHGWCCDLLSNQQIDQHMDDVLELIEFMDGVSESDQPSE